MNVSESGENICKLFLNNRKTSSEKARIKNLYYYSDVNLGTLCYAVMAIFSFLHNSYVQLNRYFNVVKYTWLIFGFHSKIPIFLFYLFSLILHVLIMNEIQK